MLYPGPPDMDLQFKKSAVNGPWTATASENTDTFDLGSTAHWMGYLIVDIDALTVADTDETYNLQIRGADNTGFTTNVQVLGSWPLGTGAITGDYDTTAGLYKFPFANFLGPEGDTKAAKQYLRVYVVHAGTTTSLTWSAELAHFPV
jgi:hypothetical protein